MSLTRAADCAEDKTLEPLGSSDSLHATMLQRKDSSHCMESQLFQPPVSVKEEGHSIEEEQMVSTSFPTHSEVSCSEGYTVPFVAHKNEKGHSDELSSSTNDDILEGPAQPPLLPSRSKEGDGMLKTTSLTVHLQSDVNVATATSYCTPARSRVLADNSDLSPPLPTQENAGVMNDSATVTSNRADLLYVDLDRLTSDLSPVASKWLELGIQLEVPMEELDAIGTLITGEQGKAEVCLQRVVLEWLSNSTRPITRDVLVEALGSSSVGEIHRAKELPQESDHNLKCKCLCGS